MANVTITSDSNHDDLTTRGAGQNITINLGAVLTMDSYVQETPMGLMGTVATNDGTWRIDGRNVKEFAYSSGSGSLPAIGDTITDSGGASGKVIYLNSGDATSGVMTVTQQSGIFASATTLTSGSFSATLNSVKVGYLQVFTEDTNHIGKGLGNVEFLGTWYELGIGDGTDGQTFTLPHNGTQQGIWIETGSGTGVYERWFRKDSTTSFTDYQTDELGKCFDQPINGGIVTFGTSTNGNTPPNGARLRIPNTHLGTATLASPTTEVDADIPGSSMWNVGVNSSLSVTLDTVNLSTIYTSFSGVDSLTILNSSVAVTNLQLCNAVVDSTVIDNSVLLGSRDYNGDGSNMAFTDVDGVTVTNSFLGAYKDNPIGFNTSSNITLNNSVLNGMDPTHANNNRRIKFTNCSNVNAANLVGIRTELVFEVGTTNCKFTNYRFSDGESSTLYTNNPQFVLYFFSGASNVLFDGITLIPNGSPMRNDFVEFVDSINCIIRNVGSVTDKTDFQNHTDFLASFSGVSSGCKLQRVYVTGTRNSRATDYRSTTINCEITNCSSGYDRGQVPDSKNTIVQGMHGCSGNLNSLQGLEVDFPLTAGVHGLDFFTSDTEGRIHVVFSAPTADTAQYVTLNGGAVFNREGDLLLRNTGDSAEIEIPYLILGHDSFTNVAPSINGNFVLAVDVFYSLDTGSGFGAYKEATAANLSAETISPSGFKIKFKFEAPSDNNNRLVNGFFVETATTLSSQENNLYPFARPIWGYNLTQAGSKIAVYDNSTGNLVGSGNEDGAGVTACEIPWEVDFLAYRRLRLPGYEAIESLTTITEQGGINPGIQSAYSLIPNTDPNLTAHINITNHGVSPVSWDAGNGAKDYSITIQTDSTGDSFTASQLLNEINYSISQEDTYFGFSGMTWPEMLVQAGTSVETARGQLFGSDGATLKGVRVIKSNGDSHPAVSRFQADDGTYGQAPVSATGSILQLVPNSRVMVTNVTTGAELFNLIEPTVSFTNNYTNGTTVSSGDVIDVRATYQVGATATLGFSATTVANEFGWSVIADQETDDIHTQAVGIVGLDGSQITKFAPDYVNNEVDIIAAQDFSGLEPYLVYVYYIYTEEGIRNFFGAITALDIANFRNNVDVLDLFFNNHTAVNIIQTDSIRWFKSNGVYPVRRPTLGGGGINVYPLEKVFVATTGGSSLTPAQAISLTNIEINTNRVDGLIEDDSGDQFTTKALSQASGGGGGSGATPAEIYTYFTDGTREDAFKASVPSNIVLDNDPRLDNLDETISSRASQTSVNSIPTNPVLTDDSRLDNLDTTISSRASQTTVDGVATHADAAVILEATKQSARLKQYSGDLP